MVGEADSVNLVSESACHLGGPKGATPRYYKLPAARLKKFKKYVKNFQILKLFSKN